MSAGHLIAASAHRNRDLKGDAGPGDYMLGSSASLNYKVAYALRDWIAVMCDSNAKSGNLTIEQSDYDVIKSFFNQTGINCNH